MVTIVDVLIGSEGRKFEENVTDALFSAVAAIAASKEKAVVQLNDFQFYRRRNYQELCIHAEENLAKRKYLKKKADEKAKAAEVAVSDAEEALKDTKKALQQHRVDTEMKEEEVAQLDAQLKNVQAVQAGWIEFTTDTKDKSRSDRFLGKNNNPTPEKFAIVLALVFSIRKISDLLDADDEQIKPIRGTLAAFGADGVGSQNDGVDYVRGLIAVKAFPKSVPQIQQEVDHSSKEKRLAEFEKKWSESAKEKKKRLAEFVKKWSESAKEKKKRLAEFEKKWSESAKTKKEEAETKKRPADDIGFLVNDHAETPQAKRRRVGNVAVASEDGGSIQEPSN